MLITFKVLILLAVSRLEASIGACFACKLFFINFRKLLIARDGNTGFDILNFGHIIINSN